MIERIIRAFLITFILFLPVVGYSVTLDQPHHPQGSTSVNCGNCHWTSGGTPPWSGQTKPSGWSDADWTINNQRCWVCHSGSNPSIPAVNIHSASTTSTQYWSGAWTTECVSCHNPHYQRQPRAWRTDPDLYLAQGTFTVSGVGAYDSVNNRTQITLSGPLTEEYQGYYFIPDKNYPFYYQIISSTLNATQFYVRGDVNEIYVKGNGYAIVYGKNIKDYISFTNPGGQTLSTNIRLFRPGFNQYGGFIDSNNYSTSLCQACHTNTINFTITNPNHSTSISEGANCLNPASGCHQEHLQGFAIAGAKCGVCHGVPPSYYNSPTDHNLVKKIRINGVEYDTNTGVTTPGAHVKHSQTSSMTFSRRQVGCTECHNTGMQPSESDPNIGDYMIQIGINATTVGYQGATYDGRTSLANGFTYVAGPGTTVTTTGSLTCSSVYCHGSTIGGTANPVWTGTIACGDCHKATAADPPTLGSHVKHAGNASTTQSAIACSNCHGHSGTASSAHVDGSATWSLNTGDPRFGPGAIYRGVNAGSVNPVPSSTYGQCTNLYCHSNANPLGGTNQFSTVTWGGASMACNSCHSSPSDASPTWSVSHTKHVKTYGANPNFTCNACHSSVASDNTTISDKTLHVNAQKDVAFNAFNPSASPYDSINHQCSNLYCHSNASPLGGTNVYMTATWNTTLDCGGCHKKADTRANMTSGSNLMSSAHVIHVASDEYGNTSRTNLITCQTCHNTVASGNSTISNYANHVNAQKDVSFDTSWIGGSPSYSGSPSYQCSSVYCHSDGQPLGSPSPSYQTVAWNAGALNCNSCHASSPNTNAHPKHTNAGTYNMGCVECHQSVVSDNSTISSKVLHVNKLKDVAWKTGGYNADGGAYSSPNCTNIYCHSQGTENAAPYSSPNVTAAWNTTLTCKGCHDFNAAATPDIMSTGAHTKHVNNATVMGVNFTCSYCHNTTVSSGDSPITDFTKHVNKKVNIAFTSLNTGASYAGQPAPMEKTPGSTYGACTNLYCHSSGNTARGATPTYNTPSWLDTFTTDCDQCHGDAAGKSHPVYASGAAGSATANSHVRHVETAGQDCEICHYTTTQDGTTIVGGGGAHLNGQEDVSFISSIGGSYNADTTCSSTYCHGTTSPQWGATGVLNCGSCHESMGAGGTASYNGSHLKHSGVSTEYNFSCEQCHTENGTLHAGGPVNPSNQAAQIVFTNGTGTGPYRGSEETNYKYYTMFTNPYTGAGVTPSAYTPGGTIYSDTVNPNLKYTNGTCNNLWCHSNAAPYGGTDTYASVSWGATLNCGSCHASTGSSAPHTKHITTYSSNLNMTCNACHANTASDNTTISNKAEHVDTQKDINFNTFANPVATWNAGAHQCSNTYCHSMGTSFTSPTHVAITWSGTTSCTSCHGNPPSYTSGSPKANSHVEHVQNNGAICYNCHSFTVDSVGAISNFANHVDKEYDLQAGGTFAGNPVSFTYTYGSPSTCSNISCHGGTSATWGAIGTPCQDCHLLNQADVDDFTFLDGTKAVISSTEWLNSGHGRITGNYPVSGNPPANFEAASPQQCYYCHDNTVLHGTSNFFRLRNINDPTWGMNGVCQACHATGSSGITVNGVLRNGTRKVDSRHYGTKHSSTNNGGQFCWDCHDPHGDSNIYMVHLYPWSNSDVTTGKPTNVVGQSVSFTNNTTGTDYARSSLPYDGICNVCHVSTNHYTATSGDGHNSGTRCTSCHPHTGPDMNAAFSPSGGESSGGSACSGCHSDLYNRMHDSTASMVYKHYMNNDDASSYPTSATPGGTIDTNRKCLICHVDHNIFRPDLNPGNGARGKNLRTNITTTPTTTSGFSDSDFDATTGGICLSCHVNQQTKAVTTPNNVSTVPPIPYSGLTLSQATGVVKNSTHNYAVTSGAFSDSSTFKAVCLKCHNDTMNPKSSMNAQSAEPKFGLHQSGRNSFFAVMGSGTFKDFVSGTITGVSGTTITVNQDLTKDYTDYALVVTKANGSQSQRAIITATDTTLDQVTVASWPVFTPSVNDLFEISKNIVPLEEVCFNCHSQGSNSGGSGLDKPNNYKSNDGYDYYNTEPMDNRLEQLMNVFNADAGRLRDAAAQNATTINLCTNNTFAANELTRFMFRAGAVVKSISANTATAADTTCQTNYGLTNYYTITVSAIPSALSAGTSYKVAKPAAHPLDNAGRHKPDEHLTATTGWNLGEDNGSCTSAASGSCTDTSKRWVVGSFAGKTVTFTSGTCAGTYSISSNTTNSFSFTPACTPAAGDTYYIGTRHISCSDCHNTHAAEVNPSGTVTSVDNTPPSNIFIKDTSKTYDKTGWANDRWKGYLIMITKSNGFRQIRQITSSLTDTTGTTYYVGLAWNTTSPPAAGDKYEVFKQDGSAGSGQKGVWGVSVSHLAPNTTNAGDNYRPGSDYTYTKTWDVQYQRDLCMKCHSYYGFLNAPPTSPSPMGTVNTVTPASDIAEEANPNNLAHHAIYARGKNQPITATGSTTATGRPYGANRNWPKYTTGTISISTAGTATLGGGGSLPQNVLPGWMVYVSNTVYPTAGSSNTPRYWFEIVEIYGSTSFKVTPAPSTALNNQSYAITAGLGNTFVPPFGPWAILRCTDCHGSTLTDPLGPHASVNKFLVRSIEPVIGYEFFDGTSVVITTEVQNTGTALNYNYFCFNCHRRSTYGDQGLLAPPADIYSRVRHGNVDAGGLYRLDNRVARPTYVGTGIHCNQCHAGYRGTGAAGSERVGGIHGTNFYSINAQGTARATWTTMQGKRFLNGASWAIGPSDVSTVGGFARPTTTTSGGCYVRRTADSLNRCTQGHRGDRAYGGATYDYDNP